MEHYAYSALATLATTLVGWPVAHILLPSRLRHTALAIAPTFGFAYIIFAGYFCYRLNFEGANVYAYFLAAPAFVALFGLALSNQLSIRRTDWIALVIYLFAIVAASQYFLVPGGRAIAFSLGNLDIVELATEARFLQEFARNSTIGFLGQSDELRFIIDIFWAGPSLFCAFLSALLGSAPYKLQSIALCIVSAQGAVFVWLIAREGLSLRKDVSAGVALLYAVNPINAYILWMAFGAQTTSMPLLLVSVFLFMVAMQEPGEWKQRLRFAPALILLLTALLTNYHFMLLIIGLLLGTYLFILALARRSTDTFLSGVLLLGVAASAALVVNPFRSMALAGHLSELLTGNNGWFIPWLSPEVQFGVGAVRVLFDEPGPPTSRLIGAVPVVALGGALAVALWRERNAEWIAFVLGLAVPCFLVGLVFAILGAENAVLGSYRSFKITGTFVAFTLLAFAIPFSADRWAGRLTVGVAASALFVVVFLVDLRAQNAMVSRGRNTGYGYIMPEDFPNMQKLEQMPFSGVNFADAENFDLFWSHYFTLRKRQIYTRFPYGRPILPFEHAYTVMPVGASIGSPPTKTMDIFHVDPKEGAETYPLNSHLQLVRAADVLPITIKPGDGWWHKETTYRWTGVKGRIAKLSVTNDGKATRVRLFGRFDDLRAGNGIEVRVGSGRVPATVTRNMIETETFELPPGESMIELMETLEPTEVLPLDPRAVGTKWYELHLKPLE